MSTLRTPPRPLGRLERLEDRDVPAVIALPNEYRLDQGQSITIPANRGLLSNDFSDTNFGAILSASLVGQVNYFDFDPDNDGTANLLANPVPANTVTVNPDGSITFVIPSNVPANVQGLIFLYQADNVSDPTEVSNTAAVVVYLGRPTAPRFAVGADEGAPPVVRVYNEVTGQLVQTIDAYDPSFTGGVRVAVADFNADGVPDVATAPGVGGAPHIRIFDGRTGRELFNGFVFGESFTGGAHVAAGDVNGDGFVDLIVGAGVGGGPRVQVMNGQGFLPQQLTFTPGNNVFFPGTIVTDPITLARGSFDPLMDFFAYEREFRGGVRVAAGDVAGVGYDYIVTAPGGSGGPVVKTFDYFTVVGPPSIVLDPTGLGKLTLIRQPLNLYGINANGSAEATLSFFAGDERSRVGVNVTTADVDGDGRAEIVTGPAAGPAVVKIFNGQSGGLISQFGVLYEPIPTVNGAPTGGLFGNVPNPSGTLLGPNAPPNSLFPTARPSGTSGVSDISANQPALANGGITVTGGDFDSDGKQEIIVGSGRGNAPNVRVYKPDGTEIANFLAFPATVLTGINVG